MMEQNRLWYLTPVLRMGPVDFVFDDDGMAVVCLVRNQLIRRLKFNVVAVALELCHEIGARPDDLRPTGDVVENLVDDVVGDYVEEVLAINEVAQSPSDKIEIGLRTLVGSVFGIAHYGLAIVFACIVSCPQGGNATPPLVSCLRRSHSQPR